MPIQIRVTSLKLILKKECYIMANVNNENVGIETKKKIQTCIKDIEELKKMPIPVVCFNLLGLDSDSARFTMTSDDLVRFTKDICNDFFGKNGVHDVEFDSDRRTGVNMFVWFKWDSPHIVDTSLLNDDKAAVNKPVPRLSKEVKQFMELYCREENRRLYGEGDNRYGYQSFKCLKLDVFKLFCAIFDSRGRWYNAVYEGNTRNGNPPRSVIIVNAMWEPDSNRINKFVIEKRNRGRNSRTPIKPTSAFKGNNRKL